MLDILGLPATELLKLYKTKTLSPVEAMRPALSQIQKVNPQVNAFAFLEDEKRLLQQARESEARWMKNSPQGLLDGLPVTIKDDTAVAGWVVRDGSLTTPEVPAMADAPVAARLREAGAIFIGSTTAPEFCHKGVTDSPLYGITRNPWDTTKTTGGSSGGAAAATATRMGWLHVGSDGGGSIRIPANFCGIFGIKPTTGLIPRFPQTPFSSLASAGPMTRTVAESALMLDIIALPDPRDGSALPYENRHFAAGLATPLKNLRIAYTPTINATPIDPEVACLVADAAKKMQRFGSVEEISLDIPELVETFNTHWMAVAGWLLGKTPPEKRVLMDPHFLRWAQRGAQLPLNDYIDAELGRMSIISQMQALFNSYDVLIMPVTPMPAFDVGLNVPHDAQNRPWDDWTPLTFPANLARLPAASLPCGVTAEGLPVGVQLMSGFLRDNMVLNAAHALERETGFQDWLARQP